MAFKEKYSMRPPITFNYHKFIKKFPMARFKAQIFEIGGAGPNHCATITILH